MRGGHARHKVRPRNWTVPLTLKAHATGAQETRMNNLIWLVGAIVIIIAVLSFFGLR